MSGKNLEAQDLGV